LSQGLPIVACRTGAVPDVVPEAAGFLVPVDDVEAFAGALEAMLCDTELRQTKAAGSRHAGALLPAWPATAAIISDRLRTLA
jgi:glycosyltransferase involved in cell wall biosynthesis